MGQHRSTQRRILQGRASAVISRHNLTVFRSKQSNVLVNEICGHDRGVKDVNTASNQNTGTVVFHGSIRTVTNAETAP